MDFDIKKIARDASIELPEEYKEDIKEDLIELFDHMKHLLEADLEGFLPTFSMVEAKSLELFEDIVDASLSPEVFLESAPSIYERYFVVPRGSQEP